ncbi:MAG: hypothetical protein A2V66_03570 [Ignavibacteria bacterium RBG_13_36_8]|nr:MAG: hypothetical protein A2V66_03570 [Ignavibacteria bacterium RBG_13_36_8]
MDYAEEVKNRIKIVDLASRVWMKPENLFVKSWDHADESPSLRLYPKTNSFYDWSRGYGGDVIDFYMRACRVDFKTALVELCSLAGIAIDGEISDQRPAIGRQQPLKKTQWPPEDFWESLTKDEKSIFKTNYTEARNNIIKDIKIARLRANIEVYEEFYQYCITYGTDIPMFKYLAEQRKLNPKKILLAKIFFVWDYFKVNNHLKKKFKLEQLQKSGLYNSKGNLIFAKHRIIIPYLKNDKIIYLRGRYFDEDENPKTDKNKYIGLCNDGMGLQSSKRFYNEDVMRNMFEGERLFITEGEFDCIALNGLSYRAICIPGAGNIPDERKFIVLLNFESVIIPDNDDAGERFTEKLVDIFHSYDRPVTVKQLPEGVKDVNELLGGV